MLQYKTDLIHRIKRKLTTRKINHYLQHPASLFTAFKKHTKLMKETMYLLNMKLNARTVSYDAIEVECITSLSSILPFIRVRQKEDVNWRSNDYYMEVKRRFECGHKCFALRYNKEIVSTIFIGINQCYIAPVAYNIRLPSNVVGFYDVYTVSAYRGKGFYAKLFNITVNKCMEEGFDEAWMWIMPHNVVSLKVHDKLGMNHIFKIITLYQRFGIRWHDVQDVDIYVRQIING